MAWRAGWALASVALFAVLVVIAVFVRDGFVRPFLGDVLAVVWLHASARAVVRARALHVSLAVLALAFVIEFAQLAGALSLLGLESNRLARVVLGSTFDVLDLLAYVVGWAVALGIERALEARAHRAREA